MTEGANDANDVEASSDLLLFTTSYTKDSSGRDRSYLNQSRKKVYYLRVWEVDANGGSTGCSSPTAPNKLV